jgi:hypothetical protein
MPDRLCKAARAFFIEAPHDRRPPPSASLAHASGEAGTLRLCRLPFCRNPGDIESGGTLLKETARKETGLNRGRSPRC